MKLDLSPFVLAQEDIERSLVDVRTEVIEQAVRKVAALNERNAEAAVILELTRRCAKLEAKLAVMESQEPDGFREIVEAVAHIGVDFGYGNFALTQDHIEKARALLEAAPPHSQQSAQGTTSAASREDEMVVIEFDSAGTPTVWCDPEIVDLVTALNKAGIRTVASCSGHGYRPGNIALADGRELFIASTFEEAREIDQLFLTDINGNRCPSHDSEQGGIGNG